MAKLPCFQFALLTGVPSVIRRILGPLRYPFGLVAYQSSFVGHQLSSSNLSYYRFDLNGYSLCRGLNTLKYKMCSRRISRVIRMLSAPLAVAFLVILYRESQYNKINQTGDWEFEFSAQNVNNLVQDGLDAQFLANNLQPGLEAAIQFPDVASNFEVPAPQPQAAAVYQQPPPPPAQVVNEVPAAPVAPAAPLPVEPVQPVVPAQPPAAPVPVAAEPQAPAAPEQPAAAPESPAAPPPTPKPYVKKVMGEVIDHPMMNFDEPENVEECV